VGVALRVALRVALGVALPNSNFFNEFLSVF
jgi:hypothetical protein